MRYFQPPQQQIVAMDSPINVDFYKSILDKAQQNLDQGTMMKNKYLEDVYNQKYMNQEAHDIATSKVEGILRDSLNSPFINPSKIGTDIVRAGRIYAPYKAVNERQLELAKQEEEFKQRYGANALTSNAAELQLMNENGEFKSPNELKSHFMNYGLIDDLVNSHEKGFLTSETPEQRVHSDIPFQIKLQTKKGLSDAEKKPYYGDKGTRMDNLVDTAIKSYPELMEIFKGDRDKIAAALKPRIQSVVGQYGQDINTKYVDDVKAAKLWELNLKNQQDNRPTVQYTSDGDNINTSIPVGQLMAAASGDDKIHDWSKVPFNSKTGTIMTSTPIYGGTTHNDSMFGDPTAKKLISNKPNMEYGSQLKQMNNYMNILNQAHIPFKNPQDALRIISEAAKNSAQTHNLTNNTFTHDFDAEGTEMSVNNPEINIREKDGSYSPINGIDDLKKVLKLSTQKELEAAKGLAKPVEDQIKESSSNTMVFHGRKTQFGIPITAGDGTTRYITYNPNNTTIAKGTEPLLKAKQLPLMPGRQVINWDIDGVAGVFDVVPVMHSMPDGKGGTTPYYKNEVRPVGLYGARANDPDNIAMWKRIENSYDPNNPDGVVNATINESQKYSDNAVSKSIFRTESAKKVNIKP